MLKISINYKPIRSFVHSSIRSFITYFLITAMLSISVFRQTNMFIMFKN